MPITLPDAHGLTALGLTVLALLLFSRDRIPLETSAIVVLTALVLVFEIFPYARDGVTVESREFFYGFGHEALITIAALMILGKGMETTNTGP